jgi:beta-N-acetylhexosaminidase
MNRRLFVFIVLIIASSVVCVAWLLFGNGMKSAAPKQPTGSLAQQKTPSYVDMQLADMTLKQKVACLLILHVPGTDVDTLRNYLATYQPGGLIFMGDNIPATTDELTLLTSGLQTNKSLPYLLAVDEEGGDVKRLPDDIYPAAIDLKNQTVSATSAAFNERSNLLHQVGLNLNFGIVADVTSNPNSFIYPRVFGGDPTMVGDRVAAAVIASKGLTLSTLKHFPGHGETEGDSHASIPNTDIPYGQWQLRDKTPFQSGINAGADVVMFGHLVYNSVDIVPASLSIKWHDILKNQLNFTGLTVTDDMIMLQNSGESIYADPISNAVQALLAGNTMLLYVLGADNTVSNISIETLIDGVVVAVEDGKINQDIIDQNARKVLFVRHSLSK